MSHVNWTLFLNQNINCELTFSHVVKKKVLVLETQNDTYSSDVDSSLKWRRIGWC